MAHSEMTGEQCRAAMIAISGTVAQFCRDYGLDYQAALRWCKNGPPNAGALFIGQLFKHPPN